MSPGLTKQIFLTYPDQNCKFQKSDIMYTTYHLASAQEVSTDILDAIKATFKSKPITIIEEEDDSDYELTSDMKAVLDERLQEDESTYLSAEESINHLNKKYGL
jgi:hypothetical protein